MQSSGGVFTFEAASERPVFVVESGPAAAVIAAANLGKDLGYRNLISLDMGGTTAKVGLIRDGSPQVTKEYELGAAAQASVGAARGKGYPVRTPVIDLVGIGAGGGRHFALVAFGGAGPVHAGRLAAETGAATLIVPVSPGTFSAMGLLVTDLKHDYSKSVRGANDLLDAGEVESVFSELARRGEAALARDGVHPQAIALLRSADMRYVGQSYELNIPLPSSTVTGVTIARAASRFHVKHDRAYGFSAPDEPVELVNVRLSAVGGITKPELREWAPRSAAHVADTDAAKKETRSVYFAETSGFTECPVYDRYALATRTEITGPAIVEEADSTTAVHPGPRATVDRYGNLLITSHS